MAGNSDIRIFFNGAYEYTQPAADFSLQTVDTISSVKTVSLQFDPAPVVLAPDDVRGPCTHVFDDPDGNQNTLYLSYRLKLVSGNWYITEFGSSEKPAASGS